MTDDNTRQKIADRIKAEREKAGTLGKPQPTDDDLTEREADS